MASVNSRDEAAATKSSNGMSLAAAALRVMLTAASGGPVIPTPTMWWPQRLQERTHRLRYVAAVFTDAGSILANTG